MGMTRRDRLIDKLSQTASVSLRALPPEPAHNVAMWMLERNMLANMPRPNFGINMNGLACQLPGIGRLDHPIGLAAGFDKDARALESLTSLGFSHIEVGTITPHPQSGNPKPRMFRYPDQNAIINRMGFNSEGAAAVAKRLKKLNGSHLGIPVGVNLGKNKHTALEAAAEDFITGLDTFKEMGDYFVINISSPNTAGLRDLANEQFLEQLASSQSSLLPKIWVKLDPDMEKSSFMALINRIGELGFQGVILCNTHKVNWPEVGGQSGHPLATLANARLEWAYEVHRGKLPMIAVGGIFSGLDVFERIARGASAVQIYSAFVYRGPWVVYKILRELRYEMQTRGIEQLAEIKGSYYN